MKTILFCLNVIFVSNLYAQTPGLQWVKKMGDISENSTGTSIAIDQAGNVYTAGRFYGAIDLDPSTAVVTAYSIGDYDVYISKLDALGNFVWGKTLGGTGSEEATGIALDSLGNVYVSGIFANMTNFDPYISNFSMTELGGGDNFIMKLNTSGNFVWAKQFGSYDFDRCNSIAVDHSGHLLATGRVSVPTDFDPSAGTFTLTSSPFVVSTFALKWDLDGNFVWAKLLADGTGSSMGLSINADASDNVIVAGYFSGNSDFDPSSGVANLYTFAPKAGYVVKLDANGNYQWAVPHNAYYIAEAKASAVDDLGNVYITGYFEGALDFDPSLADYTLTGAYDAYLAKLDAAGNFQWAFKLGESYDEAGSALTIDNLGNVYVAGRFNYTIDFDPSTNTVADTSNGDYDGFICKYDASGSFIWKASFGSISADEVLALAIDDFDNVHAVGYYERNTDFDPSSGVTTLPGNIGNTDAFVLKLSNTVTTLQNENEEMLAVHVFPNPASISLTLQFELYGHYALSMLNATGDQVYQNSVTGNNAVIDVNQLPAGMYVLTISGEQRTKKVRVMLTK